jgi:hypothetical protein
MTRADARWCVAPRARALGPAIALEESARSMASHAARRRRRFGARTRGAATLQRNGR